ncbi:MAG: cell division protein FtsQ/DivIB [Candidatus Omnitrophota bacterium]
MTARKKSQKGRSGMDLFVRNEKVMKYARKGIPFIIVFVMLCAFAIGANAAFFNIPFFRVTSVVINDGARGRGAGAALADSAMISLLRGKNIFKINISSLSRAIMRNYPDFKKTVVERKMPDTLLIKVTPRVPAAYVKSFGYYLVDDDGVVLSPETAVKGELPVMTGFPLWTRIEVGERLDSSRFRLGLALLRYAGNVREVGKIGIQGLDVSNTRNPTFTLRNGIEIRVGQGELERKMGQLKAVLEDPNIDKENLKYIDLRFDGAVLGPKQ